MSAVTQWTAIEMHLHEINLPFKRREAIRAFDDHTAAWNQLVQARREAVLAIDYRPALHASEEAARNKALALRILYSEIRDLMSKIMAEINTKLEVPFDYVLIGDEWTRANIKRIERWFVARLFAPNETAWVQDVSRALQIALAAATLEEPGEVPSAGTSYAASVATGEGYNATGTVS